MPFDLSFLLSFLPFWLRGAPYFAQRAVDPVEGAGLPRDEGQRSAEFRADAEFPRDGGHPTVERKVDEEFPPVEAFPLGGPFGARGGFAGQPGEWPAVD